MVEDAAQACSRPSGLDVATPPVVQHLSMWIVSKIRSESYKGCP